MGLKNGYGIFKFMNGAMYNYFLSSYEGEFKNNLIEGEGRYKWADGREYVG